MGTLEPIPGLADINGVSELDRRDEHIRHAVPSAEAAALDRDIPLSAALGGKDGALNVSRRGFDLFRNGEPAELVKLPGVLGG